MCLLLSVCADGCHCLSVLHCHANASNTQRTNDLVTSSRQEMSLMEEIETVETLSSFKSEVWQQFGFPATRQENREKVTDMA